LVTVVVVDEGVVLEVVVVELVTGAPPPLPPPGLPPPGPPPPGLPAQSGRGRGTVVVVLAAVVVLEGGTGAVEDVELDDEAKVEVVAAAKVRLSETGAEATGGTEESVAFTVRVKVPGPGAVPLRDPVAGFRLSQVGRPETDHRYDDVPPDATREAE
jgi:hypothetical protein